MRVRPFTTADFNSTTTFTVSPSVWQVKSAFGGSSENVPSSSHNVTKSSVAICPASRAGRSVNQPVFGLTSTIVSWSPARVPPSASCTYSNDGSSPSDSDAVVLSEPHPASNNTPTTATQTTLTPKSLTRGALEVGPSFVKTRPQGSTF